MMAKKAILSHRVAPSNEDSQGSRTGVEIRDSNSVPTRAPEASLLPPQQAHKHNNGHGAALTDTPASTAPSSPRM